MSQENKVNLKEKFMQLTGCKTEEECIVYFDKNNVYRDSVKPKEFENTDYVLYIVGSHNILHIIKDTKTGNMQCVGTCLG
jgi:hypothetical protein